MTEAQKDARALTLELLAARAMDATICPSEVARAIAATSGTMNQAAASIGPGVDRVRRARPPAPTRTSRPTTARIEVREYGLTLDTRPRPRLSGVTPAIFCPPRSAKAAAPCWSVRRPV